MRRSALVAGVAAVLLAWPAPAGYAEAEGEWLAAAREALRKGRADEAATLAGKVLALNPKSASAYLTRGIAREVQGKHAEAVSDLDSALRLQLDLDEAYHHRGCAHFKLGRIKESAADFDRYVERVPSRAAGHWQRGITLYYAGRFEDGMKQFKSYEQVDTNDVENAVWHYLCNARRTNPDKARQEILKIGKDRRVPMMQVYELYSGRLKPEDVLAAAQAGQPEKEELHRRLFYAHLYLGLYHEAAGDRTKAREHLGKAAGDYRIGHYMGDVARVHRDLLKKEK
jgi:lipoprotein NlpI